MDTRGCSPASVIRLFSDGLSFRIDPVCCKVPRCFVGTGSSLPRPKKLDAIRWSQLGVNTEEDTSDGRDDRDDANAIPVNGFQ